MISVFSNKTFRTRDQVLILPLSHSFTASLRPSLASEELLSILHWQASAYPLIGNLRNSHNSVSPRFLGVRFINNNRKGPPIWKPGRHNLPQLHPDCSLCNTPASQRPRCLFAHKQPYLFHRSYHLFLRSQFWAKTTRTRTLSWAPLTVLQLLHPKTTLC